MIIFIIKKSNQNSENDTFINISKIFINILTQFLWTIFLEESFNLKKSGECLKIEKAAIKHNFHLMCILYYAVKQLWSHYNWMFAFEISISFVLAFSYLHFSINAWWPSNMFASFPSSWKEKVERDGEGGRWEERWEEGTIWLILMVRRWASIELCIRSYTEACLL